MQMKVLLRRLGLTKLYWWYRARQEIWSTYVANILFQRVLGVNRSCPWSVHYTSRVIKPERITIHPSVKPSFAVSGGCYIQAVNGLEIGEGTLFAPGVKIISANHSLDNYALSDEAEPIRIGKRCWIGTNAVILPGVQLGDNVVVGAGSVVTKSFGDNSIIAGVPARLMRVRECK